MNQIKKRAKIYENIIKIGVDVDVEIKIERTNFVVGFITMVI